MDDRLKQLLLLGREHYDKREFDRAEVLLAQVVEQEDRFADVYDMLGVIAHARGDFAAAEGHFERALAINPSYTEAALNLVVAYNDHGRYESARRVYAQFRTRPAGRGSIDPFARGKLANLHADLAQAYADVGLRREAILELTKAVGLCPDFADLRTRLGTYLREAGDLIGAREQYEAAVQARPLFVPARIQLGVTWLALGDSVRAEAEWRRALEIEPEHAHAKMYLRLLRSTAEDAPLPPEA